MLQVRLEKDIIAEFVKNEAFTRMGMSGALCTRLRALPLIAAGTRSPCPTAQKDGQPDRSGGVNGCSQVSSLMNDAQGERLVFCPGDRSAACQRTLSSGSLGLALEKGTWMTWNPGKRRRRLGSRRECHPGHRRRSSETRTGPLLPHAALGAVGAGFPTAGALSSPRKASEQGPKASLQQAPRHMDLTPLQVPRSST